VNTVVQSVAFLNTSAKVVEMVQGDTVAVTQKVMLSEAIADAGKANRSSIVVQVSDEAQADETGISAEVPLETLEAIGSEVVIVLQIYNNTQAALQQTVGDSSASIGEQILSTVSLDIYAVNGSNLTNVRGGAAFPQGIRITILRGNITGDEKCAFLDEATNDWSESGLVNDFDANGTTLTCITTHLTLFGALVRQAELALICSNWRFMSLEGLRQITNKSDWAGGMAAIFVWLLGVIQLVAVIAAWFRDHRYRLQGDWTERMYCNSKEWHDSQKMNVVGMLATAILGGDELAALGASSGCEAGHVFRRPQSRETNVIRKCSGH